MKCSSLAIHCTSLCLDVIQQNSFSMLSFKDIQGYQEELYSFLLERTELTPRKYNQEHLFICAIRDEILRVLLLCKSKSWATEPAWILGTIESKIKLSLRLYLEKNH